MSNKPDLSDPEVTYHTISDDSNVLSFINSIREGIKFSYFMRIAKRSPFKLSEWSVFLHLSERTMQRYKKEQGTFDALQSEKILQIALLNKLGIHVFGSDNSYHAWLDANNVALGKVKPKSLLDSAFGINLVKDVLTRIEHGVLA